MRVETPEIITANKTVGVILVNLGTPAEPTPKSVRAFLKEFLSDQRVIEIPKPIWQIILNCFVLPFRPKRVAKLYESVWEQNDSPMRRILNDQCAALEARLKTQLPETTFKVLAGMTYGQPGLKEALAQFQREGIERIVVLPLFPQYSATSTAAAMDVVSRWLLAQRNAPSITVIKDYFDHPLFIKSLANSVREHWEKHGRAERLLMSFHGIPQPYADKGDPYAERCRVSAALLARELNLSANEWACSFQSRFGKQEWVKPYTDVQLIEWAQSGIKSVQVMAPAFSADCLETLEEIAQQNQELFVHEGGERYEYIPALNERGDHLEMIESLVLPHIKAWQSI